MDFHGLVTASSKGQGKKNLCHPPVSVIYYFKMCEDPFLIKSAKIESLMSIIPYKYAR